MPLWVNVVVFRGDMAVSAMFFQLPLGPPL